MFRSRLEPIVFPIATIAGLVLACSAGPEAEPDPFLGGGASGAIAAGGAAGAAAGGSAGAAGSAGQGGAGNGGNAGAPPVAAAGGPGVGGSNAGAGGSPSGGAGGGSAGTGGGSSGTGGGSSGTGGAPAVGAGCDTADIVCDDFESAALGQFPNGPAWDVNSCTSHVVDATVAHAGVQSLRGGAEQYPACMAHTSLDGENELYARSWIRLGAASSESGHEIGFMEFGPTLADNPEVRVGVRNDDSVCAQAPGVEVTADGIAGGERTSCSGLALDADRWYCLEVHFARAAGSITFSVSIDGSVVVPETTHTEAVAAWSEGPLFMKLGRSSYGGNNVFPVWHDDVVVSTSPVGCAE
jgi:hypothetical protein